MISRVAETASATMTMQIFIYFVVLFVSVFCYIVTSAVTAVPSQ